MTDCFVNQPKIRNGREKRTLLAFAVCSEKYSNKLKNIRFTCPVCDRTKRFVAIFCPSFSVGFPTFGYSSEIFVIFFLIKHCDMTFFSGNSCCCFSADHFSINQQINITCFTFARHIFRIADGEVKSAINFIWMQINCRGRNPKKVAQIVFAFFFFSASESNKNEWNAECNKKNDEEELNDKKI